MRAYRKMLNRKNENDDSLQQASIKSKLEISAAENFKNNAKFIDKNDKISEIKNN